MRCDKLKLKDEHFGCAPEYSAGSDDFRCSRSNATRKRFSEYELELAESSQTFDIPTIRRAQCYCRCSPYSVDDLFASDAIIPSM